MSGNDYDHRRQWIRDRLEFLASVFGIEVLGFAVMSNHLHVVLRTRPDVVNQWSNGDVAGRWLRLFPPRHDKDGTPLAPERQHIDSLAGNHNRMAELRQRLISISWFMRCTAEVIARQANREDDCTGRFWEGRFRAHVIPDEAALAACLAYVDLNPIRAGLADTPEASSFTSAKERITDLIDASDSPLVEDATAESGAQAGWLSPIELDPPHANRRNAQPNRRVTNKGCLPMTLGEYLALVDWTGRQLRSGASSRIAPSTADILDRLGTSADLWLHTVQTVTRNRRQRRTVPKTLMVAPEASHKAICPITQP